MGLLCEAKTGYLLLFGGTNVYCRLFNPTMTVAKTATITTIITWITTNNSQFCHLIHTTNFVAAFKSRKHATEPQCTITAILVLPSDRTDLSQTRHRRLGVTISPPDISDTNDSNNTNNTKYRNHLPRDQTQSLDQQSSFLSLSDLAKYDSKSRVECD